MAPPDPSKFSGNPDEFTMSFGDHLDELRKRILLALIFPVPASVITFVFSNDLINILLSPLYWVQAELGLPQRVQALGPPEVLLQKIKLSIIAAIIVSLPWIMYQLWRFVGPGLYAHERRFVYFLIPGSAILTAAGVVLMHFLMLPLMLYVLVGIGANLEQPATAPTMDARLESIVDGIESIPVRRTAPDEPQAGDVWLLWPEMTLYAAVAAEVDEEADASVDTVAAGDGASSQQPPSTPQLRIRAAGDDGPPDEASTGAGNDDDASDAGSSGVEVLMVPPPQRAGIEQAFRMKDYLGFVLLLYLAIVIAFQMPLVIVLLGWMGLADAAWLKSKRKYALLVLGAISAMITPADVISMVAMLIPLYALYELGILLLRFAPASAVAEGRFSVGKTPAAETPRGRATKYDRKPEEPAYKPETDEKSIPRREDADGGKTPPADGP